MPNAKVEAIHRFPVKGFAGHSISSTNLTVNEGIPHDRQYAISNGTMANTGEWMHSRGFFVNSIHDGVLEFALDFDPDTNSINLRAPDNQNLTLELGSEESLVAANEDIGQVVKTLTSDAALPAPQIIERPSTIGNWDFPDTPISLINMESIAALEQGFGLDLNPQRFRCNVLLRNLPAWEELGYLGKRLQIGSAELDVMRPILRCPAPGVNPENGKRDLRFAEEMPHIFGHAFCGMYAKVVKSGKINTSSTITVIGDAAMPLEEALATHDAYPVWPRLLEITTYEIGENCTRISLKNTAPWPLPDAKPGQRLRFHMAPNLWTTEYITATSPEHFHLEVTKSDTDDPATEHLRNGYGTGDKLVISGPFGRV